MELNFDETINGYQTMKIKAEKHNFKIYNSTRGSCLEVFERIKLKDALK